MALKVLAPSKNENLYLLASAQRNWMQPILVSCEASLEQIFCKLLLNGASNDTKIGCIKILWAGAGPVSKSSPFICKISNNCCQSTFLGEEESRPSSLKRWGTRLFWATSWPPTSLPSATPHPTASTLPTAMSVGPTSLSTADDVSRWRVQLCGRSYYRPVPAFNNCIFPHFCPFDWCSKSRNCAFLFFFFFSSKLKQLVSVLRRASSIQLSLLNLQNQNRFSRRSKQIFIENSIYDWS